MAAAVAAVRELELNEKIFVVDLGGGTFDISVLEADQANHIYRALDIEGDRKLGRDDFDKLLYNYFIGIIQDDLGLALSSQKKSGLDHNEYYSMMGRILEEAEKAKIDLSDSTTCDVIVQNLFEYNEKNYDFNIEITREEFDNICKPIYDKIISRIKKFISESDKFKVSEISTIILAGGSCYIPKVREEVEKIFKKADSQLDLDSLVVIGACYVAESINGALEIHPQDILSHSFGVEVLSPDGKKMILSKILNKGDESPCEFSKVYTTVQNNQTTVPIYIYVVVTAQDENSGVKNLIEIKKGDKPVRKKFQASIDFMLLLDTSGSMDGSAIKEAKRACETLFSDMIDFSVHSMGLITFDSYAKRCVPLTRDAEQLKNVLRNIRADGGTDLYTALQYADEDLDKSQNKKVVIIVTDGYPFNENAVLKYAADMKNSKILIATIGADSGVGE